MDRRKQIDDFFKGELSEEQVRELLDWLDSSEGEEYLSAEILQHWSDKSGYIKYKEWNSASLLEKINKNKKGFGSPQLIKERKQKNPFISRWTKIAASFVVFGFLTWLVFTVNQGGKSDNVVENYSARMIEKFNPAGQKTKIHLPDGSTIFLNSESRIVYSEEFVTNRHIRLEGEAFFNVAKDENNPFTVSSNGIITTALGTSFNISTFNNDGKVVVTLVSGKVKLNTENKEEFLILNPGEESVLSKDSNIMDKRLVNVNQKILWMDGVLSFDNTSMNEMVAILERWYGVQIKVKGNQSKFLASGRFENNETLTNVLQVLSASIGFDYKLQGKEVLIEFK